MLDSMDAAEHQSAHEPAGPTVTRTCLLVLGMHRSGTSALSAVLGILGADLGDRLLGPAPDNPKGYFEDGVTVGINQFLLDSFFVRGIWPASLDWYRATDLKGARPRIDATLAYFDRAPLFLIKDPRLCLTLPLWLDRGAAQRIGIRLIYTARNPLDVVRSLATRDNVNPDVAAASWFLHTTLALANGRAHAKMFCTYEGLLADTDAALARLAAFDPGMALTPERRNAVDAFLDAGLQHHRASAPTTVDPLLVVSMRLYEAIASGDEAEVYRVLDAEPTQCLMRGLLATGIALARR